MWVGGPSGMGGKGCGFGSGFLPAGSDLDPLRWIDLLMKRLSPPCPGEGDDVERNKESADSATGNHLVLLLEEIARMQVRMGAELGWLNRLMPTQPDEPVFRFWHRKLGAIEALGIRTEEAYFRAESSGRFAGMLHAAAHGESTPSPSTTSSRANPQVESLVVLLSAVAHADGIVHPAEQEVAARVIVDLTGTRSPATLVPALSSSKPDPRRVDEAARQIASQLDEATRRSLIRILFQVAQADGFIVRAEVDVIASIGAHLGYSKEAIELIWRFNY